MKDKRTYLAHKAEHVVDLDTQAIVAVNLGDANEGDTSSMPWSLLRAELNLDTVAEDPRAARKLHGRRMAEVVADKGYHSNEVLVDLRESRMRSHVSEPARCGGAPGRPQENRIAVDGNGRTRVKPRWRCMAIDVASEVPVATVYRNVAPRSSSGVSPTHTIPEACGVCIYEDEVTSSNVC